MTTTATQRAFLSLEQSKKALEEIGTKFATVSFVRNDGTLATYSGMLRCKSRRVGSERGKEQAKRMGEDGQRVIDLPEGGVKSFYLARLVSIKSGSVELSAE